MRAFCVIVCSLWVTLCLSSRAEGKRVVVFPVPSTSHTKYLTNVARELTKLGHQVWLTMPDYMVPKGFLDTNGFTVIEYAILADDDFDELVVSGLRDNYFKGEKTDYRKALNLFLQYADTLLKNESFYKVIKDLRPDFVVIDNIPMMKMLAVIPYRLGIPFSFVGTAYDPMQQRIPFSPAVTPNAILGFNHNMTFWQRVQNTLLSIAAVFSSWGVYPDAVARYAPEMPYLSLDMLAARAELWLVELDHILDYPRPSLPNVKLIGGTATGPARPLPSHLQSFMDGATHGVVVVSFGSWVLNLPKSISDKVLNVLKQLPMRSVFRSNLTSPDPAKILTSTWIPQNDLLGHANTKVFVSHCGKNGQYEALYHAVPIVATPFFGDQFHNAERARVKGMAEVLDLRTCTEEELKTTILRVTEDPRYKQAISTASKLFRVEFGVPMERAAFWLDHVMNYGGQHMRSAGQEMPYYRFLGLDVYAFIVTAVGLVLSLIFVCVRKLVSCLCNHKRKKD